jgi:hypothetical protein
MRNQAIAGALVAALLAFDIVGFMRCVAYLWPSLGPLGLVLTLPLRFKFKNASPAARAGLPRISFAPYEFVGGDSVGLVFYPGAAVEAAAYAPLCRRVAEEAKATVILARPPFRMVITTRGFRKLTARHPGVKTWAIGGHSHGASSLGAVAVANETEVRGLAMLGAVPMNLGRVIDLSARRDIEVLNVLASEDNITSPKKGAVLKYGGGLVEDMFKMLPKSTRRVVIKGGNHASDAASEALRHRRDLMLRAGASATTASRRTTASAPSASRTSRTRSRGTSCRSSSASGSAGSSGSVQLIRHRRDCRRR